MNIKQNSKNKLSLLGFVWLGTGVIIGVGIFGLMGQIAELVGKISPLSLPSGCDCRRL